MQFIDSRHCEMTGAPAQGSGAPRGAKKPLAFDLTHDELRPGFSLS
jgi:hypothetical protein